MAKPVKPIQAKPTGPEVVFRTCNLFIQTASEKSQANSSIGQKIRDFRASKSANKLQPFGSSDKPFKSFGVFEGLRHAHLTNDLSIVYSMHGANPTVIDLYGVFSHDELGTGQPVNIKRQQSMDKRMKGQTFS